MRSNTPQLLFPATKAQPARHQCYASQPQDREEPSKSSVVTDLDRCRQKKHHRSAATHSAKPMNIKVEPVSVLSASSAYSPPQIYFSAAAVCAAARTFSVIPNTLPGSWLLLGFVLQLWTRSRRRDYSKASQRSSPSSAAKHVQCEPQQSFDNGPPEDQLRTGAQ